MALSLNTALRGNLHPQGCSEGGEEWAKLRGNEMANDGYRVSKKHVMTCVIVSFRKELW